MAPELVIEIISPNDRWQEIRKKLADYFLIDVNQVWIVEPAGRKVLVYRSLTDIREFAKNDTLAGEDILKGFKLNVADLFVE